MKKKQIKEDLKNKPAKRRKKSKKEIKCRCKRKRKEKNLHKYLRKLAKGQKKRFVNEKKSKKWKK